jgi:hypothetical protein
VIAKNKYFLVKYLGGEWPIFATIDSAGKKARFSATGMKQSRDFPLESNNP